MQRKTVKQCFVLASELTRCPPWLVKWRNGSLCTHWVALLFPFTLEPAQSYLLYINVKASPVTNVIWATAASKYHNFCSLRLIPAFVLRGHTALSQIKELTLLLTGYIRKSVCLFESPQNFTFHKSSPNYPGAQFLLGVRQWMLGQADPASCHLHAISVHLKPL